MKQILTLFTIFALTSQAHAVMFGQLWQRDLKGISIRKTSPQGDSFIKVSYRGYASCAAKARLSAWEPSAMIVGANGELSPAPMGVISRQVIEFSIYIDKLCVIEASGRNEEKTDLTLDESVQQVLSENFRSAEAMTTFMESNDTKIGILAQTREAGEVDSRMLRVAVMSLTDFQIEEKVVY